CVPTGMKAGVCTGPWGVPRTPARAAPERASTRKGKAEAGGAAMGRSLAVGLALARAHALALALLLGLELRPVALRLAAVAMAEVGVLLHEAVSGLAVGEGLGA